MQCSSDICLVYEVGDKIIGLAVAPVCLALFVHPKRLTLDSLVLHHQRAGCYDHLLITRTRYWLGAHHDVLVHRAFSHFSSAVLFETR